MKSAFSLYAGVAIAASSQLVSGAAFTSYTNSSTSTTASSSSSNVASSPGIGAYVAQGLGLSSSEVSSSQLSTNTSQPSLTSSSGSNSQLATTTPAPSPLITGNQTNFTGAAAVCQNSWNTYWSLLGDYQTRGVTAITGPTVTTTYTAVGESVPIPFTTVITTTFYSLNPAQESSVLSLEYTPVAAWSSELSITKITSLLQTWYTDSLSLTTGTTAVHNVTYSSDPVGPSPTPPPCSAPIDADACRSLWSAWSSTVGACYDWQPCAYNTYQPEDWNLTATPTLTASLPTPNCYQLPVNESYCGELRKEYLAPLLGGYYGVDTTPEDILAPGCTLGCGQCTLTAQTFQILYWSSQASNNTRPATAPATVVVDGSMTLTSPQVYLSFNNAGATDYCSAHPETIQNGIVAINSDALAGYGQLDLAGTLGVFPTAINHYLYATPLPWSQFLSYQILNISTFALSIPQEVKTLNAAWGSCVAQGYGIAEPPSVLTPTMVITPVGPVITSPAAPALAITTTVASTTQTALIAQTPTSGLSESSESAAAQTPESTPQSSQGSATVLPQTPTALPVSIPQSSENVVSATTNTPASVPPSGENGQSTTPQIQTTASPSTPQPSVDNRPVGSSTSLNTAALISSAGAQDTPQAPSAIPTSTPQSSEGNESASPQAPASIAATTPSSNDASPQTGISTPASTPEPDETNESPTLTVSPVTAVASTPDEQETAPASTPQTTEADESLLPLVAIITAALDSTDAQTSTQASAQQPHTVPFAASAITEQSETGGLQGPQPTQTPQASGTAGAQAGNSNDAGGSAANSHETAVAAEPSPASSPAHGAVGYGAPNNDGGNNAGTTASNPAATAVPIFVPQTPSPSAAGSSDASATGNVDNGSNSGNAPGSQNESPPGEILLTIGSTVVTARQTEVPAPGSIGNSQSGPVYPASAAGSNSENTPGSQSGSPAGELLLTIGSTVVTARQTVVPATGSLENSPSGPASSHTTAATASPVIVVGSMTLTAGGSAQVIQGQTVSYGSVPSGGQGTPGGLGLVVGSSTTIISSMQNSASGPATAPTASPVIVFSSSTLTAGGSAVVIQGQTVSYGSVSPGQSFPGVLGLVVGTSTTIMNLVSGSSGAQGGLTCPTAAPTALSVIIYGSSTLTAGGSVVVIQGQTVSYGSVSPGGLGLVVGTSTTIMNLASGAVSGTTIGSGPSTKGLASTASSSRGSDQESGVTVTSSGGNGAGSAPSSSAARSATTTSHSSSDGNVLVARYWKWTVAFAAVFGLVF